MIPDLNICMDKLEDGATSDNSSSTDNCTIQLAKRTRHQVGA